MKIKLVCASFFLVITWSCVKTQERITLIDPNAFEQQMNVVSSQIIDVRTPLEYAEGHIANAININVNEADFTLQIIDLDKNKPVMVYCKAGGRSAKAASILKDKGFKQVYDLDGGMIGWNKSKKKVVND